MKALPRCRSLLVQQVQFSSSASSAACAASAANSSLVSSVSVSIPSGTSVPSGSSTGNSTGNGTAGETRETTLQRPIVKIATATRLSFDKTVVRLEGEAEEDSNRSSIKRILTFKDKPKKHIDRKPKPSESSGGSQEECSGNPSARPASAETETPSGAVAARLVPKRPDDDVAIVTSTKKFSDKFSGTQLPSAVPSTQDSTDVPHKTAGSSLGKVTRLRVNRSRFQADNEKDLTRQTELSLLPGRAHEAGPVHVASQESANVMRLRNRPESFVAKREQTEQKRNEKALETKSPRSVDMQTGQKASNEKTSETKSQRAPNDGGDSANAAKQLPKNPKRQLVSVKSEKKAYASASVQRVVKASKPPDSSQGLGQAAEKQSKNFAGLDKQLTTSVQNFLISDSVSDSDIQTVKVLVGDCLHTNTPWIRNPLLSPDNVRVDRLNFVDTSAIHGKNPGTGGWEKASMPPKRLQKWKEHLAVANASAANVSAAGAEGRSPSKLLIHVDEVDLLHRRLVQSTRIVYDPVWLCANVGSQQVLDQVWRSCPAVLVNLRELAVSLARRRARMSSGSAHATAESQIVAHEQALEFLAAQLFKRMQAAPDFNGEQWLECLTCVSSILSREQGTSAELIEQKYPHVHALCGEILVRFAEQKLQTAVALKLVHLYTRAPALLASNDASEVCVHLLQKNLKDEVEVHRYTHVILRVLPLLDTERPIVRSFFYDLMVHKLRWAGMVLSSENLKVFCFVVTVGSSSFSMVPKNRVTNIEISHPDEIQIYVAVLQNANALRVPSFSFRAYADDGFERDERHYHRFRFRSNLRARPPQASVSAPCGSRSAKIPGSGPARFKRGEGVRYRERRYYREK